MNSLLKPSMVKEDDLQQPRSFYDQVELNVQSLVTVGVTAESFKFSTVVIDKLLWDIKLLIVRHIKDTWNLTKILVLLNEELKARETVKVEGKNVDFDEVLPFTGSSLVVLSRGTSHQPMECSFCKAGPVKWISKWNTGKHCRPPCLADKKHFWI